MTQGSTGALPANQLRGAGPLQSGGNRFEQALVHHLLDNTIQSLTDRMGTTHMFPWTPDQEVRIGVLGATFNYAAPASPTAPAADDPGETPGGEPASPAPTTVPPVDNRGVIGFDFVVRGGVTEVILTIDVEYAIYQPLVPNFDAILKEAQTRSAATATNPRRRPTVPVNPDWYRDNRHVSVTVSVPVSN